MTDAGSAGDDLDHDGGWVNRPDVGGWKTEPEPRARRGWLFAAFAVVVIAIGAAVVKLAVDDTTVPRIDPGHLAVPVTLPPSSPAPKPPPEPTVTQTVASGDVCPGSDKVSADDQPGWQHASVEDAKAPCAGSFSLHATSTAGGVSYRWTSEVGQAGHCDIAVYVPDVPQANVARVHYSVLDGGRLVESFVIAQANHHGQLVPAGSYPASGNGPLTVRMDNQAAVPGTVIASAVRFTCHPG